MALSAFICLFALLVLVVYQLRNKIHRYEQLSKFQKARGCGAPRQTTNRLLGLLEILQLVQALKKNYFLKYVEGLFGKYGNTFAYNTIGTQAIWTMEPENIKACLSTQSQDFEVGATRHNTLIPLLGHSILTTDGSQWAHHRAMIRPNFVKSQLVNVDIFEKHVSNLLACIPQDNSTFDIRDLFQKLTMDISTDFLLGCSTNSLALHATRSKDEFSEAWATAISWLPLRAHLGSLMNWIPHPSFFKACKTVQAYADELVAFALASRQFLGKDETSTAAYENRYIFLHELAKEVTDPIQLRDHVISVLSAGRDTTSELLSCTINILVKNRGVLALLREEVSQLNGQKPTFEMLKEMGYLRNVLFEVLRLYPVGPVNARIATKDTTLPLGGGADGSLPVMVQKGQQVLYCVYGMHRRKDLYGADAEEFRPERWGHRRQGWDFLPFNGGARNCIGQSFAMTEASYILIRLLQEFDEIEARDSRMWKEHLGLILSNFHGTLVGLTRNLSSNNLIGGGYRGARDILMGCEM